MRTLRLLPYLGIVGWIIRGPERLFDPEYYLASNPDVAGSRIHPLLHFLMYGAFEGRKPNPLFDPGFYLRMYRDVARAGVNPFLHYLKCGAREGRRPHPLFEPLKTVESDSLRQFLRDLARPSDAVLYSWRLRGESQEAPPPLVARPRFSLLLAVYEPRREWLEEAIASVRAQSYAWWELCVAEASDAMWLKDYVTTAAREDPRIRAVQVPSGVPESAALNRAAALAGGDYLAILGQHDRLASGALHWLAAKAPADLIYSDEDRLDGNGIRSQPLFKPDWSPDLLFSGMYMGGLLAISRTAWEGAGGFRPEYDEAREYDLALRVTETARSVRHVPRVLYSRRGEEPAGCRNASAGKCLLDGIRRRRIPAEIEPGPRPCSFRLFWKASGAALVSIIVCSRSAKLLEQCLASLAARTVYSPREVIVVQHLDGEAADLQAVIAKYKAGRIPYSGSFDFSRMNNLGADAAKGEILVFLNDDTEPLDASWLDRLVGQVERPGVGVAGARLLYASGALQHAGVAIGVGSGCGHIGRNTSSVVPHWPWLDLTRDVSAVTGACLAVRAPLFRELGGFSEKFPVNYNDIDLCLRVREAGWRVIYEAGAVLWHYECQSRSGVVTQAERELWHERWSEWMDSGDPFYNPNLTRRHEDLSLRDPASVCD